MSGATPWQVAMEKTDWESQEMQASKQNPSMTSSLAPAFMFLLWVPTLISCLNFPGRQV